MKINKLLLLCALIVTPAWGDVILNPDSAVQVGVGGYARIYTGKLESYQYNTVLKSQPHVTLAYQASDDVRLSGKVSYRFSRNDRFHGNREAKWYDVYGTVASQKFGQIDFGKTTSVGYNLHQGATDVSLLAVDDSDLDFFYEEPNNFFAPDLTFLKSDSRDVKLNYTSPEWRGFTWGLTLANGGDSYKTYAPNKVKVKRGKGVVTAVRYLTETPVATVGLSAGYAYYYDDKFRIGAQETEANHSEYSVGIHVEKNHYSWGASYKQLLFQNKIDIHHSDVWGTGVAYDVEKYGVSLNYLYSRTTFVDENKYNHLMLSGKYRLHKYIETNLSVGRFAFMSDGATDAKSWFGILALNFKL